MKTSRPLTAWFLCLGLFLGACQPPTPEKPGGLGVGDEAYLWVLQDSSGQKMKLTDLQPGMYLIQILYRGHWCSACLNQLLDMKRDYPRFLALKATVACISTDDRESSADFNASWKFPFPLLSDRNLEVIDAYGARHPNGHEGKDISKPVVLIISPDLKVVYKYLGHSPVDRPTNADLLDWLRLHPVTTKTR